MMSLLQPLHRAAGQLFSTLPLLHAAKARSSSARSCKDDENPERLYEQRNRDLLSFALVLVRDQLRDGGFSSSSVDITTCRRFRRALIDGDCMLNSASVRGTLAAWLLSSLAAPAFAQRDLKEIRTPIRNWSESRSCAVGARDSRSTSLRAIRSSQADPHETSTPRGGCGLPAARSTRRSLRATGDR